MFKNLKTATDVELVDAIWQGPGDYKLATYFNGGYLAVRKEDFVCYKKNTFECPEVPDKWRCKVDGIFVDSADTDFSIECKAQARSLFDGKKCCS